MTTPIALADDELSGHRRRRLTADEATALLRELAPGADGGDRVIPA